MWLDSGTVVLTSQCQETLQTGVPSLFNPLSRATGERSQSFLSRSRTRTTGSKVLCSARAPSTLQGAGGNPFWQQVFSQFTHLAAFLHFFFAVHDLHFFGLSVSLKVAHSSTGGGDEGGGGGAKGGADGGAPHKPQVFWHLFSFQFA